MKTQNHEPPLTAMRNVETFATQMGAEKEAAKLKTLAARLETEQFNAKQLDAIKSDIFDARGHAAFKVPLLISRSQRTDSEKKSLDTEFSRLKNSLNDALYPPKIQPCPETQMTGLIGDKDSTTVRGDPALAPKIAKQALDVVNKFSTAIFQQDLEAAYALCANELRGWMSVKRFFTELTKADKQYGGKAVADGSYQINFIWTNEAAALSPNSDNDFPKDTPKSNKRATIVTYWFTNPPADTGRSVAFYITEEAEGYRIAKFSQFVQ